MAKKRRKFRKTEHEETNFELQITALIDTLVILLIFMLKTTALESLEIETEGELVVPMVHDGITEATPDARLSISKEGLYWNGNQYVFTKDFEVVESDSKATLTQWSQLSAAIQSTADSAKETKEFSGKVYLEADRETPYPMLDRALKLARQQGYKDIRFVGARYN